jgi:hypothetical protein
VGAAGTVTAKTLTPQQRTLRARKAALDRWSRENPAEQAARGQAGLPARFEREAREADPAASDAEIARRAESARRAHMAGLALASSKARGARKAGNGAGTETLSPEPGAPTGYYMVQDYLWQTARAPSHAYLCVGCARGEGHHP